MEAWLREHFPGRWEDTGKQNWLCNSPLREDRHPSFSINTEKRCWLDRATGDGGRLSDLCRKLGIEEPSHTGRMEPSPRLSVDGIFSEAQKLWDKGIPAGNHPYLERKGIDGQGLRVAGDVLLVPAFGRDGALKSVERISPDGRKMHLGPKAGTFFPCGNPEEGKPFVLAEGMATGKSLHALTGWPVLCAFGAENLPKVAGLFKDRELVVCPDHDAAGDGAGEACRALGAVVVELPEGSPKGHDWNDVVSSEGIERAQDVFQRQWSGAQKRKPQEKNRLSDLRSHIRPDRAVRPEMIGGIFPRGGVSVVAGQQGAGKSLLMQKFCSDLSMGGVILDGVGDLSPSRKTVYFVGELPVGTMNDRQRTAGWEQRQENFVLYSRIEAARREIPLDLTDGEGFKNIRQIIQDEKPDIVIFDSLMSFSTSDESDMKTMQGVFSKLVRLSADEKIALVLVHHIRKRKSVERQTRLHQDDIIGSSTITRNASLALVVEKIKEDIYVSTVKSWYAPLDEFSFQIERDEFKVFRGLAINLKPEDPFMNKLGAIENVVFKGHKDGSDFTVAGVAKITGATDRYVRKLFREWEESGRIVSRGGSKNTSYSIMQKFRNHIQTLGITEKDSGTTVPESSGIFEEGNCTNCIPELPVPESLPVIATAQGTFRNYSMSTGKERSKKSLTISSLAERAGVSPEIVREALSEYEATGQIRIETGGGVTVMDEKPAGQGEASSSPGEDGPSLAWLEAQGEEVRTVYREKLERLNIIGVPDHEALALQRTWEEFHRPIQREMTRT